jgi:hypothetical protein
LLFASAPVQPGRQIINANIWASDFQYMGNFRKIYFGLAMVSAVFLLIQLF